MAEGPPVGDRLDELLVARATEGLNAAQQRELVRLLARHPEVDAESYERAAAAVCLAALGALRAMPGALRERVARSAQSLVERSPPRRR